MNAAGGNGQVEAELPAEGAGGAEAALDPVVERRRRRLREELADEGVPLPLDGALGDLLLEELDHARHPEVHEGLLARYGALVLAEGAELWPGAKAAPEVVELGPGALELGRRLADGRAAFLLRSGRREPGVVFFDRSLEYESSLVDLQRGSGAIVVQRAGSGLVRAVSEDGIVTWDSIRWTFKPLAAHYAPPIRRLVPGACTAVLDGLLELCVHWLSAGHVGATLVWVLDADEPGARPGLDLRSSVPAPELSVARDEHFPGLLSAASQMDRAIVVGARGRVRHFGVGLRSSDRASKLIAPVGGTRHTSARRYSFDDPASVVFVVSQDGPVTVFRGGASAAELRIDPCGAAERFEPPRVGTEPGLARRQTCRRCRSSLLVDVVDIPGWAGGPEHLECPVCGGPIVVDVYRAALRGVLDGPGSALAPRKPIDPSWCPATRP